MSTRHTGWLGWELWKQHQANLERVARDAWMFDEPTTRSERPNFPERVRGRIGKVLLGAGRRLAEQPQPGA